MIKTFLGKRRIASPNKLRFVTSEGTCQHIAIKRRKERCNGCRYRLRRLRINPILRSLAAYHKWPVCDVSASSTNGVRRGYALAKCASELLGEIAEAWSLGSVARAKSAQHE
jgi:hypothetical protein